MVPSFQEHANVNLFVDAMKALSDLAAKYKYAKLTITTMEQGLDTIQLAWSQIGEWFQSYQPETKLGSESFLQRLQRSLENGSIIMNALEGDLRPYQTKHLGFKQRSKALWNENTLHGHQDRISHQATAMTCLLQAIQLKSSQARDQLLKDVEPELRKSDESAYSIVPSRMSSRASKSTNRSSACTEVTGMEYRRLDFEDDLFTAVVYKRNYRNPLIDRLFQNRRPRSYRPNTREAIPEIAVPGTADAHESLQVHAQKEFAHEQAEQSHKPALGTLGSNLDDRAFFEACNGGKVPVVEAWLKSKGSFTAQNSVRKLLLLEAMKIVVTERHYNLVHVLHGFQVPVNNRSWWRGSEPYAWLPLQHSVSGGDLEMTKLLLNIGAVTAPTNHGTQPLHIAAHTGDIEITAALLNAGANVNATDSHGFQPIHLASTYHNRAIQIRQLSDAGASIEAENSLAASWQNRPLQLACLTGQVANVQSLIDLGATMDVGRSLLDAPLGIAIRRRHVPVLETLLRHGADPNYASKSKTRMKISSGGPGMTPLCLLAKHFGDTPGKAIRDQAMLELLLQYSADFRRRDDDGNQVLHYLCKSQYSTKLDMENDVDEQRLVMTLLTLREYDLDATNEFGERPLFLAALNFNHGLFRVLISRGARQLGNAESFRLHKVAEDMEKKRPHMEGDIRTMMELVDPRHMIKNLAMVPRFMG